MAPRNKRQKTGLRRIDAALDAMRPLGFPDDFIRKSIKELLKVYGNEGWVFIEENSYKVLIDAMLNEQAESDHDDQKSLREICNFQGNTQTSEEGQCSKMVPGDHEGDAHKIGASQRRLVSPLCGDDTHESRNNGDEFIGVADMQMENCGKDLEQTIGVTISSTDDNAQQQQGRVHADFAPISTCPQTVSSNRRRKPCYGWISDDDEEDEEDNFGTTNLHSNVTS